MPESTSSKSRCDSLPTHSVSCRRSMATISETFATDSLTRPVALAVKSTFPGAPAHFKALVSGTQTTVLLRLRFSASHCTTTTGRRRPRAPWPPEREDHHDLHPRAEQRREGCGAAGRSGNDGAREPAAEGPSRQAETASGRRGRRRGPAPAARPGSGAAPARRPRVSAPWLRPGARWLWSWARWPKRGARWPCPCASEPWSCARWPYGRASEPCATASLRSLLTRLLLRGLR
jgi:hypothetical protein